jgi:GNAT superfamily N-acetyltransferase
VAIEVRPAVSRRDRREFLALPFRLHANAPQWCPPLLVERRFYLSRRFNPFFSHGDAQLFLARRDGRVVGRISAQVDDAYNSFHELRWGWFGFLELEDDQEVMDALLAAAEAWCRERGMERMVGPCDFTMNEESGIVVEGHDKVALIKQPWQPPYYQRLAEGAALGKAMDLLMWNLEVQDRSKVLPVMFDLAEKVESEHGIKLRKMSRLHLRKEMDRFAEVYNSAWSENWGFVPYGKKDLDQYALEMQLVYEKDWFMVAETSDGKTVGVAISVPDLGKVLHKANGSPLKFVYWWLRRRSIMDRVRVGFLGIHPEFQHTGVAAAFYVEHFDVAGRHPRIHGGEMGWILESNEAMNRGMEMMGGRVVKRYRMYERLFEGPGTGAEPAPAL